MEEKKKKNLKNNGEISVIYHEVKNNMLAFLYSFCYVLVFLHHKNTFFGIFKPTHIYIRT